jgi:Aspartyl protease
MVDHYPVVVTFLNGQGPFQMMVDTGAVRCAVRRSVAARAGLVPQRPVLLATLVGEKMVSAARTPIRVGSLQAPETEVLINDLPGLDRLESHVDGLLGQNFLAQRPYLIDYRARRLWLGEEAVEKAQRFGPPRQIEFSSGRPILPVTIDSKVRPLRLLLDSGVNDLVLRCGDRCGTLLDEHTVRVVTNAGEMAVQKGRLPVAMVGSERFFRKEAVLMKKASDPSNAEGAVPLEWFSAVYVHPAQGIIRWAR